MIYSLLFLVSVDHRWYFEMRRDNIKVKRLMEDNETACSDNGQEFLCILEYLDTLKFKEKPDYGRVKFMLSKIILDYNLHPLDCHYPWVERET